VIHLLMPYDRVFCEVEDRESPWGSSDHLRSEIAEWLDGHLGEAWDYDICSQGVEFHFGSGDLDVMLLFKLTWG